MVLDSSKAALLRLGLSEVVGFADLVNNKKKTKHTNHTQTLSRTRVHVFVCTYARRTRSSQQVPSSNTILYPLIHGLTSVAGTRDDHASNAHGAGVLSPSDLRVNASE